MIRPEPSHCPRNYFTSNANAAASSWQSILSIVFGIVMCVLHWIESQRLAKSFGKGTGFGVCLFFFGPIARLILGFGSAQYVGKP